MEYNAPDTPERRTLNDTRRRAIALALSIAGVCAACVPLMPWIYGIMRIAFPFCLLDRFGLRCPLCGGTRCMVCLANLDFRSALYYNPLVVLCAAAALYLYIRLVISCFAREYKPFRITMPEKAMWWMLAGFLTFLVIRNFPFYRAVLY